MATNRVEIVIENVAIANHSFSEKFKVAIFSYSNFISLQTRLRNYFFEENRFIRLVE